MTRSGTLLVCVQNLDFSGANQVVLNIVQGKMHESNVVILSPKIGTFASRFIETGAAIRVGSLPSLLDEIRDIFCIICNTIMTADIVVECSKRPYPVIWILHEWWDDKMIIKNLQIRQLSTLTIETVKDALILATKIIFVCESQRKLYNPRASSDVIYVGVPSPLIPNDTSSPLDSIKKTFTILVLGIICPRKNQVWAVQLFKKFADSMDDVKLLIVGARYTRDYEIEYLEEVKREVNNDPRIEIHDVTENVDRFYALSDCLLVTSTNEVTPMVIPEAMSWAIPILSTNIAGIPEMFSDGVEGYQFDPFDGDTAVLAIRKLYQDSDFKLKMGKSGRKRFEQQFDLDKMIDSYRSLIFRVAPPTILIDMDGTLVDWDSGFYKAWNNRSEINRLKSYYMEDCVDRQYYEEAESLISSKGFFESLSPMPGALEAIKEMIEMGFKIFICSAPIWKSHYCAQDKIHWIRKHLGDSWLDKLIFCSDKTTVRGDLLIDDKPFEYLLHDGKHTMATWKQVIFDAPYNSQSKIPRIFDWFKWKEVVIPLFERQTKKNPYLLEYGDVNIPRIPLPSPRYRRIIERADVKLETAQNKQDQLLGPQDEILSPEDVASIRGSSSFFLDEGTVNAEGHKIDAETKYPDELSNLQLELEAKKREKIESHKKLVQSKVTSEMLANLNEDDAFMTTRQMYRRWRLQSSPSKDKLNSSLDS